MEQFGPYGAILAACILFFTQTRQFVKPEELEKAKSEMLEKVEQKFVTMQLFNEFKCQVNDMKDKIDKIYEHIINKESKE